MTDHAIRLVGVEHDGLDDDAKDDIMFALSDHMWERAFVETEDIEWVEGVPTLSQRVGDLSDDPDADLTAFEREKLEEAAHLIARTEDQP